MRTEPVATGLSHGQRADPQHAARAVQLALERAELDRANAVILFLTPEYAGNPEAALRAAARAAGTLQVIGATGAGILTEEEWVLDSPAAAAMVLGGNYGLAIPKNKWDDDHVVLSLCTPAGMGADWLDAPLKRVGAISGDVSGDGPFNVWTSGRISEDGRAEARFENVDAVLNVSQGVRALTAPIEVAEVQGYDLKRLGNYPALAVLVQSLPGSVREMERVPLHLLMCGVTFGDPHSAIQDGRYRLNHILAANVREQSITLSQPLMRGERLFWAMRDALTAERDIRATIERSTTELGGKPDFSVLFPCMGRGPHFFGNRDRDLETLRARFPGMPIIGMYGNGEIGPLDGANHLYQYSAVVGLFRGRQ
jgi:small ligand-binding sensory domain FIST